MTQNQYRLRINKLCIKAKSNLFISALFWGIIAGIMNQGLSFVTNILIIRSLGNLYGELSLLNSSIANLQTFTLLGLHIMSTVIVSNNLENKLKLSIIIPSIYTIVLFTSITISIGSIFISSFYRINILKIWNIESLYLYIFLSIWLISSSIDTIQVGILLGLKAFKYIAIVSLIKGILSLLIIYILVINYSINGGIIGYSTSFGLSFILNLYFIRKELSKKNIILKRKLNLHEIKKIINSTIFIFLTTSFYTPTVWLCNNIIFNSKNGDTALSLFSVIYQWLVLIQFFPLQISKIALPFLSDKNSNKKKTEQTGLILCFIVLFFIITFSIIGDKLILENLYNQNYNTIRIYFYIILLSGIFGTYNYYIGQTMIANKKIRLKLYGDIIITISLLISVFIIKNININLTLPISYLISYALGSIVLFAFRHKLD